MRMILGCALIGIACIIFITSAMQLGTLSETQVLAKSTFILVFLAIGFVVLCGSSKK